MESLESQINDEYRFIVGARIIGKVRVLEVYKTREELVNDCPFWATYSLNRTNAQKVYMPILPFEVDGMNCRVMIDFLKEFHGGASYHDQIVRPVFSLEVLFETSTRLRPNARTNMMMLPISPV